MRQYFHNVIHFFTTLSLKKKLIILGIVVVLIAISVIQNYYAQRKGYLLDRAKISSLTETITESGKITANGENAVYSPTNGTIENISVKNGQTVQAGQELFKVKSSATEQEKQTATANYLAAKSAVDADNANLFTLQSQMYSAWKAYTDLATSSTYQNSDGSPNTTNRVLTDFTTTQADWYAAEAAYKNQQGVLAKDKAALQSAFLSYQATQTSVVKAPIKGIIANISVTEGSSVTIQSVLNPSPKPVLAITNNNKVEAVLEVGQTNIAKVKIGQPVTLNPDAYSDVTYKGTVARIDSLGTNNQGVITYNVYITVINPDEKLKPEMTLDGDIETNKLNDVLSVPNSAVVLNQGKKSVRVLKNNKVTFIPVAVGIKSDERTQIVSGLNEGQEIIVALTNEQATRPSPLGL